MLNFGNAFKLKRTVTNKLLLPFCVVIFKSFVVVMKLLLCVACTSPSFRPCTKFCLNNVESETMARQNMLYCLFSSQGDLLFLLKHFKTSLYNVYKNKFNHKHLNLINKVQINFEPKKNFIDNQA